MHYVYLLKPLKNGSLYVGCTSDLKKRIVQHNKDMSYHTKKYSPWKLFYYEAYVSKEDAFSREHTLKLHKQGLRRLKERLSNSLLV